MPTPTDQNANTVISILGAGWLGFPLGAHLVEVGYIVKGSTTQKEKLEQLRKAGIAPFEVKVEEHVRGPHLKAFFDCDVLILNIPPGRRQPKVEEYHPRQIRAVYEAAVAGGVKRLLFISSTGVYSDVNRVVTEADQPDPSRASGKALAKVEAFLRAQTAVEVTILRMAGLVGGERKAGHFLAGKKDVSNPAAAVNLVHRDDCIGVIQSVIEQHKWGEVYNVSADEHPSRRDFYVAQAQKENLEPPTFKEDGSTSFKIISNEKVKAELGYEFKHPDPMGF